MDSVILCNTGDDSISKINLTDYKVETLNLKGGKGPRNLLIEKDYIYVVNSYNNTITLVDSNHFEEKETFSVGPFPNSVEVIGNKIYVVCSEGNSILVYDKKYFKLIYQIESKFWPYDISVSKEMARAIITNFQSNNLMVLNTADDSIIGIISKVHCPGKLEISKDTKKIFLCENFLQEEDGMINVLDSNDLSSLGRIRVGKSPSSIYEGIDGKVYVSNLGDGTISILDIYEMKEERRLYIGGMPDSVIVKDHRILVADKFNGKIIVLNLEDENVKVIATGKEPTAMTMY